jgi:DNA-binding NarL/FixJ family response regulator
MVPIEDLGAASMDDMLMSQPQPASALQKRKAGLADPQKLRVLIADDHAMVRQGLCGLLDAYAEIEVIGEAAIGEEAVTLAGRFQPDIVLMDVSMPKMDGVEATRRIKQEWPGMTVIGLSVHTAGQVEAAMKEAGATAFMNKEAAVDELYQTIQTARITLQHSPQTAL